MVGQHHPARTQPQLRSVRGQVRDQHRRTRGGHRRHVVVLGEPVAGVAQPVSRLRQMSRCRQGIGRCLVGTYRDEIKDRKPHDSVNVTSRPVRSRHLSRKTFGGDEDVVEHGLGEPAGERVLLARVKAAEQRDGAEDRGQRRGHAMAELGRGFDVRADQLQGGPPRKTAQRDDHPHRRPDESPFGLYPGRTGCPLVRGRRIGRWCAAHRGGHAGVDQLHAVGRVDAHSLIGQAGLMQRREQEISGPVAGEHPPGAVGTVGGRGQPDDEDAGLLSAEPGAGLPQYG